MFTSGNGNWNWQPKVTINLITFKALHGVSPDYLIFCLKVFLVASCPASQICSNICVSVAPNKPSATSLMTALRESRDSRPQWWPSSGLKSLTTKLITLNVHLWSRDQTNMSRSWSMMLTICSRNMVKLHCAFVIEWFDLFMFSKLTFFRFPGDLKKINTLFFLMSFLTICFIFHFIVLYFVLWCIEARGSCNKKLPINVLYSHYYLIIFCGFMEGNDSGLYKLQMPILFPQLWPCFTDTFSWMVSSLRLELKDNTSVHIFNLSMLVFYCSIKIIPVSVSPVY